MSQVIGSKDALMAQAQLSDRKFVLTGPSGWIGQAVLSHLCATLGTLSGRVTAFASSERSMTLADGQAIHVRALDTFCPDDVDRVARVIRTGLSPAYKGSSGCKQKSFERGRVVIGVG